MKHQNGFGSIVKLSGKRRKPFGVRITVGWRDGKQQRKYLGYYKSEAEALMALAEYHKNGVNIDLTKLTLGEVFSRWLELQEKRNLSVSVMRIHRMAYARLGKLEKLPIKSVKAAHLQTWLDGIDLKPSSKGKLKTTMGMVFEYAVQNDIVSKNYARFMSIDEKSEKTGKVYASEEIALLWKHKDNEQARILLIMMYTGMRISEVLGMSKSNIHLDDGYMVGGVKTKAGKNRVIPIHEQLLPLVKQQLEQNEWLVQNPYGKPLSYHAASERSTKFLTELGMEHKFHDTRKTAVSLMHSAGIPMETIKIIVGHAGTNVTERVYLYKHPEELVKAINKLQILS